MKLMTLPQYMKMSKPALIRKITKTLRAMPKKRLAVLCYNITKSKLPRLRKAGARYSLRPDTQEYALMVAQFGEEGYSQMSVKERQKEARRLFTKPRARVRAFKRKTKRKFSKKQLAAQRLFAKRAKAGTLRKRRR